MATARQTDIRSAFSKSEPAQIIGKRKREALGEFVIPPNSIVRKFIGIVIYSNDKLPTFAKLRKSYNPSELKNRVQEWNVQTTVHEKENIVPHDSIKSSSIRFEEMEDVMPRCEPQAIINGQAVEVNGSRRPRRAIKRISYTCDMLVSSDEDDNFDSNMPFGKSQAKNKAKIRTTALSDDEEFDVDNISKPELDDEEFDFSGERSDADDASSSVEEPDSDLNDPVFMDLIEDIDISEEHPARARSKTTPKSAEAKLKADKELDLSLKPLVDIKHIFHDITEKAISLGLDQATRVFTEGRPLRIATMCSGTEAPLLALEMVNKALEAMKVPRIPVDHIFSAEIEPFKQAYIWRNFDPLLLFRDVMDFVDESADPHLGPRARTVFGAEEYVPGGIDILIAGSSCVDNSNLNNQKAKGIENGESTKTFNAVVGYANRCQTPIVILENVIDNKAWETMERQFISAGYTTLIQTFDTKNYYLPHTRTRKYMIALNTKHFSRLFGSKSPRQIEKFFFGTDLAPGLSEPKQVAHLAERWGCLVREFRRQASAPVTAFLLEEDDPQYERLRSFVDTDKSAHEMGWEACRGRHELARSIRNLGTGHPVSQHVPEHGDKLYFKRQPERILDLHDIDFLRSAYVGYDIGYKCKIGDYSQNVDRMDKGDLNYKPKFGISNCLTPRGQSYISDQSRPVNGIEALRLQGMPGDLNFTSETDNDLKDLAGNAMTSTIIGSAILSALIVASTGLQLAPIKRFEDSLPAKRARRMNRSLALFEGLSSVNEGFTEQRSSNARVDWACMQKDALQSRKLCVCEKRKTITASALYECSLCKHTVCRQCKGDPIHHFKPLKLAEQRILPASFIAKWRPQLPVKLRLHDIPNFAGARFAGNIDKDIRDTYVAALNELTLARPVFTLEDLHRDTFWLISYKSEKARLELCLIANHPEWRLFLVPSPNLPANSRLRTIASCPIGKASVADPAKLFSHMSWRWHVPQNTVYKIKISGSGSKTPSWRASLGLKDFSHEKRWSGLHINVESDAATLAVSGGYTLLPNCGKACGSLYIRDNVDGIQHPMYLFLDPDPIGSLEKDRFVFAQDFDRKRLTEAREIVAAVHASWRPWAAETALSELDTTTMTRPGYWTTLNDADLNIIDPKVDYKISAYEDLDDHRAVHHTCDEIRLILSTSSQAHHEVGADRADSKVPFIADFQDQDFWQDYAWILRDVTAMSTFSRAMNISHYLTKHRCHECSPRPPAITWRLNGKGDLVMHEDHLTAATYEAKLKARPPPFLMRITQKADRTIIQVGTSLRSLAHQAASALSIPASTLSWTLDHGYRDTPIDFTRFTLNSNVMDQVHPPVLRMLTLREDQRRSLTWMKQQECGIDFELEEVIEALLPKLDWKLEVRAAGITTVKGGILADMPSYGKTVTTLALLHTEFLEYTKGQIVAAMTPAGRRIKTAATLIITPTQLGRQWRNEVYKFLKKEDYAEEQVILISVAKDLKDLTVDRLQKAKIVIVNWRIFWEEAYIARLAAFSAIPEPSSIRGREYRAWLDCALGELDNSLTLLKAEGIKSFARGIGDRLARNADSEKFHALVPSKRLKGKANQGSSSKTLAKKASGAANKQTDAWRFLSATKSEDLATLKYPILHLFKWNRIVIDEFSYLMSQSQTRQHNQYSSIFASVIALKAEKRWVLSGTPPLSDFVDVKDMAKFLDLNLGIDDFTPGMLTHANLRNLRAELCGFEKFSAYQELKSTHWHLRRHNLAQRFLSTFVRQNDAEVDDIPCFPSLKPIQLGATHRAIHEELVQFLTSLGNNSKTDLRQKDSRTIGISKALEGITEPAEALLIQNSYFEMDKTGRAPDEQSELIRLRREQVNQSINMIRKELINTMKDLAVCWKGLPGEHYRHWKKHKLRKDPEADRILAVLARNAEKAADLAKRCQTDSKKTASEKALKATRSSVLVLSEWSRYLVARQRGLRYIENISFLQAAARGDKDAKTVQCFGEGCLNPSAEVSQLRILSYCGHILCQQCLQHRSFKFRECAGPGCNAEVDDSHIKSLRDFGTEDPVRNISFGSKLDAIADLLDNRDAIAEDEQALLFVPNEQLAIAAADCFENRKITFTALSRAVSKMSEVDNSERMEQFKGYSDPKDKRFIKVAILDLSSEQAAGLNLTNANHVLFLAPLLAPSQYQYDSNMLQAIRRARRYGQRKKVYMHRFIALNTVDVDILERSEVRLIQPLTESFPSTSVLESTARNKPIPDLPKLVRDKQKNNEFVLLPSSILEADEEAEHRYVGDFASRIDLDRLYDASYEVKH